MPPLPIRLALAATLGLAAASTASPPTVAAMRHERRILLIAAPSADDPALAAQRRILGEWRDGARDRDITLIEVIGEEVQGAGDTATALRRRYDLPPSRFGAALIGKDGHVALRSSTPLPAERLAGTIDAMPMRRAGGR